ncbi:archaea-specific SMC-related protein [Haloprofundus salinisoli]|uniref:archaea-specific SMC-related protein n=1 Tax=Haloprofundus salinisoli TaxID=2876193 RepID=UPI001CCDD63F|nr:archaea-specific SMC-related protein [Haloprofundus salinisoli]
MSLNNANSDIERSLGELYVTIQNLGGISQGELSLSPGVTLLSGSNASNKSSFLRGVVGVLGGPTPPVKSDAERGTVTLRSGDEEYYLEVENRDGRNVVTDAKRLSERSNLCELFVALGETNPIRRSILADGDLYELLMRPVDTAEIEANIERLSERKRELDGQLTEFDKMEDRLPGIRARAENVRAELEDVEASLRQVRSEIESQEPASGEDDVFDELNETRAKREKVRDQIRTQREAIRSLETELEEVIDQRAHLDPANSEADVDSLGTEIEQLHHQKQQLTTTINALSPIVEMNAQLLDDGEEIPREMKSDEIVAELDPTSRTVTCWTCGTAVERGEIAKQVSTVRDILQEKRDQREVISEQIRALEEQKQEVEERQAERDQLAADEQSLEVEIERREGRLSELRQRKAALDDEVDRLTEEAKTVDGRDDALLDRYDDVADLEYERGQRENELADIEAEIERLRSNLERRDDVETERDSVASRLREQRERIESLERELVTTFNEAMQRVLDRLEYENVERVWIERLTGSDETPSETEFELHVVRTSGDGTAYEDTLESLSKSEREVIGLVVAFAGYLAHDVASELPIVVVDAVEMLDAERIQGLVDYFEMHATYVVAAVLPEEATELAETYPTISTATFTAES